MIDQKEYYFHDLRPSHFYRIRAMLEITADYLHQSNTYIKTKVMFMRVWINEQINTLFLEPILQKFGFV